MRQEIYPNKLKALLIVAGRSQKEASLESGVPLGTLKHYVAGEQIIPRRDRVKLAQIIGCDIQELAPQYTKNLEVRHAMAFQEIDRHFTLGRLKTTSMILDGDGQEVYAPENIHTIYDPQPAIFFDEVLQAKEQIQKEQDEKKQRGEPYQWNGEKYHLSRISISRVIPHE